jgi:hypothetical protein
MLDGIPPEVLDAAIQGGHLLGRLRLTDQRGNPLCAAVRPPLITWTASGRFTDGTPAGDQDESLP